MWRRTLSDPGYRAVLSRTSLYATWDDHEVQNDWVASRLPAEVVSHGRTALREALAIPALPDGRLWSSYRWGRTAEIFVLDCRGERSEGACGRPLGLRVAGIVPGCEEPRIVSPEQLEWLRRGLAESPCHFKVVLTSVPMSACDGWPNWTDRWQGHAAQRNALLDHITGEGIRNVWFLTGDFHFPALARVERRGPRRRLREIFVGPGANTSGWMDHMRKEEPELLADVLPEEQFEWAGAQSVGTVLTFDPAADAVRVVYTDTRGRTVLDRTLKEDPVG
jgi:alkaline phosphatase D